MLFSLEGLRMDYYMDYNRSFFILDSKRSKEAIIFLLSDAFLFLLEIHYSGSKNATIFSRITLETVTYALGNILYEHFSKFVEVQTLFTKL